MTATSRTSEFRDLVREKEKEIPEAKRRKLSRPTRRTPDEQKDIQATLNKEYIAEGYNILNHINTLSRMLAAVRKPYLNFDARNPPPLRQASRTLDLGGADQQAWANIKHLTNEERDQIDLQARLILSRCAERIREMEALEKRRAELVARAAHPLARFIPARLRPDEAAAAADFVAAHHAGVTWYLSRRLADASQLLKALQEERVRRQLERTRTLGSGAAREALAMGEQPAAAAAEGGAGAGWLGASLLAGRGTPGEGSRLSTPRTGSWSLSDDALDDTEDDEELELSQSQIMQFELENAGMLRDMQDTLAGVQQAEARLLEISALQAELVAHLTKQTEQTEQLYEDAIATAATVEKGNVQLKEARRRARDSRKWILLFLIGASLSLLFLHYY
ncbi:syntaxin-18 [Phanerochaete sordida]|uniref:Syntaxin-18 n=1 Tax=Phanerochaete sordida TaxID=48140 RepID=A0A9P3L6V2_9APHY|nr:syntaxin-18 [Phanerochaete sordida]